MARSTCGSPNSEAKPKARTPANRPASIPRISKPRTTGRPSASVAGEAQQMPSVVDELVNVHAGNERGGALLGADEVEGEQGEQSAEYRPRQNLAQRDRYGIG